MHSIALNQPEGLDRVFAAMADPTRRALLTRLTQGPATVGELTAPFDISRPAVSKHLKVLEDAGLIQRQIEGRVHRLFAVPDPLRQAEEWLGTRRAFWEHHLESLKDFVDGPTDPFSSDTSDASDS